MAEICPCSKRNWVYSWMQRQQLQITYLQQQINEQNEEILALKNDMKDVAIQYQPATFTDLAAFSISMAYLKSDSPTAADTVATPPLPKTIIEKTVPYSPIPSHHYHSIPKYVDIKYAPLLRRTGPSQHWRTRRQFQNKL